MSIIIENAEDIELLLEFFRVFNVANINESDLRDRVNQIDKWIVEQADAKGNLAKELAVVKSELESIKEILDTLPMEVYSVNEDDMESEMV